jgi:hypothetical protein
LDFGPFPLLDFPVPGCATEAATPAGACVAAAVALGAGVADGTFTSGGNADTAGTPPASEFEPGMYDGGG